jgi:Conserved nitrate reductase-associated protein (Nitr_red_assoc)
MICHAPANSPEECAALKLFIEEATLARAGSPPKELSEEARRGATPPPVPPPRLISHARDLGTDLTPEKWNQLDEDERYALVKLGDVERPSHNLKSALIEFFS